MLDHESDSGLSGSLTDSGQALADDVDVATAARSPIGCVAGPPYSLTGSYCVARAADARRTRSCAAPSKLGQRPSCRSTRNTDRTMLELPAHDTYV